MKIRDLAYWLGEGAIAFAIVFGGAFAIALAG